MFFFPSVSLPTEGTPLPYRLAVKSAESGLRAIGAVAFQKLGDATCKVTLSGTPWDGGEGIRQSAEKLREGGGRGRGEDAVHTVIFSGSPMRFSDPIGRL